MWCRVVYMTATYFRVQSADRDPADLLDPEHQVSRAWHRDDIDQDGVSVCESPEDLARYLVTAGEGIPFGAGRWVVVELRGDLVLGRSHDEDHGERLIRPTEIVSVQPLDTLDDLISAAYDEIYGG
jgi:hypothetical protein